MQTQELLQIINKVLDKKGMPAIETITAEQTLRDDLGFDSLDLAELTVRVEDKFGVDIFANGVIRTIGDIIGMLK